MTQDSSFTQGFATGAASTSSGTLNTNDIKSASLPREDPSYLGDNFHLTMSVITLLLCVLTTVSNLGVMTFYWPKVKSVIGFIYFILSSSDFATGICAGLHSLLFVTMLSLSKSGSPTSSHTFFLIVPSYFLSVVAFKVSAFVSMIFSVIRTIRITSPLSSVINQLAVVISIFVWMAFWSAVFLIEMGLFIKKALGRGKFEDFEDLASNALMAYFYQPNKIKFAHNLIGSGMEGIKGQAVAAECVADLLYTATPVFLCAGIALAATIIQVVLLMRKESGSSDPEADRRDKTQISITIILIGLTFILCSSCTLYQPIIVCSAKNLGTGADQRMLYIMGYMPFFLNAAVNPIILILRVAQLREYLIETVLKRRGSSHSRATSSNKTATTVSPTRSHFKKLQKLLAK